MMQFDRYLDCAGDPEYVGVYSWMPESMYDMEDGAFRIWHDTGYRFPTGSRRMVTEDFQVPAPELLHSMFEPLREAYPGGITVWWVLEHPKAWTEPGFRFSEVCAAYRDMDNWNKFSMSYWSAIPDSAIVDLIAGEAVMDIGGC